MSDRTFDGEMRFVVSITALLAMASCAQVQGAADTATRRQAKVVVDSVIANKLPGADITHVSNCVIDNASAQEILKLAATSVTGITQNTIQTVGEISGRPATIQCMLQNSISAL